MRWTTICHTCCGQLPRFCCQYLVPTGSGNNDQFKGNLRYQESNNLVATSVRLPQISYNGTKARWRSHVKTRLSLKTRNFPSLKFGISHTDWSTGLVVVQRSDVTLAMIRFHVIFSQTCTTLPCKTFHKSAWNLWATQPFPPPSSWLSSDQNLEAPVALPEESSVHPRINATLLRTWISRRSLSCSTPLLTLIFRSWI